MRLSVAVWAKGDTRPRAVAYANSQNVVHIEKPHVRPLLPATFSLAAAFGAHKNSSSNFGVTRVARSRRSLALTLIPAQPLLLKRQIIHAIGCLLALRTWKRKHVYDARPIPKDVRYGMCGWPTVIL